MRPTAKQAAPTAAGSRGPMRSLRRPALGAMTRAIMGITVSASAARSSVYPSTETRKMTTMRKVPPMAMPMNMIDVLAAVNERIRSSLTGNIGEGVRSSHHMNSGKLATAAMSRPMTAGELQPPGVTLDQPQGEHEEPEARDHDAGDVDAALGPRLPAASARHGGGPLGGARYGGGGRRARP